MYPHRELIRLTARKASLRRGISLRRHECVAAMGRIASPFAWIDHALGIWRRLSPVAHAVAVPLGFLLGRTVAPRLKLLRLALRWVPIIVGATRSLHAFKGRSSAESVRRK